MTTPSEWLLFVSLVKQSLSFLVLALGVREIVQLSQEDW